MAKWGSNQGKTPKARRTRPEQMQTTPEDVRRMYKHRRTCPKVGGIETTAGEMGKREWRQNTVK